MSFKVNPIFLAVTGSRLYGNSRPGSDWDYRGIAYAPSKTYMGILNNFEQTTDVVNRVNLTGIKIDYDHLQGIISEDSEFYSFRKFIKLAWDANPNIIELLFAPNLIPGHPYWKMIMDKRELFLSQKALYTFSGYAMAQLKRLKNHKAWIDKAPTYPTREEFNLPPQAMFKKTALKALRSMDDESLQEIFKDSGVFGRFKKEHAFFEAVADFHKYTAHMNNRNPDRLKLEAQYGFDTKHASHLVRLFYEAKRLMETGELVFPLPEINIVNDVRSGNWSYEQVIEFSDQMDNTLKQVAAKSGLPKEPDRNTLDQLIQEISYDIARKERKSS